MHTPLCPELGKRCQPAQKRALLLYPELGKWCQPAQKRAFAIPVS